MYTTRDKRGHVGVCLILIFKINRKGHEIYFNFFDIPDLVNVTNESKFIALSQIYFERYRDKRTMVKQRRFRLLS